MVIVLAALYSIYRSRNMGQQTAQDSENEEQNTDEAADHERRRRDQRRPRQQQDISTSSTSSSMRDDIAASLKRNGSALYETAILRCSPGGTDTTFIATEENTTTTETEDETSVTLFHQHENSSHISQKGRSWNYKSATNPKPVVVQPPPDSVKQDWIDAVFGRDFLKLSTRSSPKSVGTSPTTGGQFHISTTTIPIPKVTSLRFSEEEQQHSSNTKLGITISRLAVGVYVKSIVPNSEAAICGIEPESILISINDLPVLAEPSHSLLSRLYQYEGYCSSTANDAPETATATDPTQSVYTLATKSISSDGSIREPVVLKFVCKHHTYSVLLLSNATSWGIQWASAMPNLSLVKRVNSIAADHGVPRGSIVVALNNKCTIRSMDHIETALQIRNLYENQNQSSGSDTAAATEMRITTAFPPVNTRTSYLEQLDKQSKNNGNSVINKRQAAGRQSPAGNDAFVSSHDGVQVKFLPLGYAIGSFFCASAPDRNVFYDSDHHRETNISDLAQAVSSLQIEPPIPSRSRLIQTTVAPSKQLYPLCPSLTTEQLLDVWDPLQSLIYCLQFQRAILVDNEVDLSQQLALYNKSTRIRNKNPIAILYDLSSGPAGADITSAFLLQIISFICTPPPIATGHMIGNSEAHANQKQYANEVTSLLLKISRRNESFCQRLYFLLRSYITTFETSKPQQQDSNNSRNLLALLNCLELLRFAENELAGRRKHSVTTPSMSLSHNDSSTILERESSMLDGAGSLILETSISGLEVSPVVFEAPASPPREKVGRMRFMKKSPKRSPRRVIPQYESHSYSIDTSTAMSSTLSLEQSPSTMYENMSDFLTELDKICATIERSLQKSFRQKIADWALQPWSAGKDAALAEVTADMRQSLTTSTIATKRNKMLLVNPVESSELLSSVDCNECYILPSAHFPLLLTFNVSERRCSDSIVGEERLYRTRVDILSLKSAEQCQHRSFAIEGAIAGSISKSGESTSASLGATHHTWHRGGFLMFETRSSFGAPQTLSIRLSGESDTFDKRGNVNSEVGFCWIDLSEQWKHGEVSEYSSTKKVTTHVWPMSAASCKFDNHGDIADESINNTDNKLQLEVRITTESLEFDNPDDINHGDDHESSASTTRKRMLLYKHDDDLRQETFAIHFIKTCGDLLKSSGLDLKLLTYQCIPVGTRRGFVEWVPGSAPLSEICHPFNSSNSTRLSSTATRSAASRSKSSDGLISQEKNVQSPQFRNGPSKYGSLRRLGGQPNEKLRRLAIGSKAGPRGSIANDPIQDFLRSVAFDANAPYLIRRDVMDTYVKSCAGYSIITYVLGVGDRHLDNLLLHHTGSFFHCDYSFILGNDPKKFLPMRITEDMIYGMGYKDSDNYAKFLSLISAAFLALRRPENVRIILSMVRLMKESYIPDISINQSIDRAIFGVRERLRLDLSESDAIDFVENLVEASLSNKLWIAVDAIHNMGKNF